MDFATVAKTLVQIRDKSPDLTTTLMASLFEQADFGEVSLLLALCRSKPVWQIYPWLVESLSSELLMSTSLSASPTLADIFAEIHQINQTPSRLKLARQRTFLNKLEPVSEDVAEQLLRGQGFVKPDILETILGVIPWHIGLPMLPEKLVRYTSDEIQTVWRKLGSCYGHVKDDGYYCQIHKWHNQVLIYTGANLFEQTREYIEIMETVQQRVEVESLVLEGELVGLNQQSQVLPRRHMGLAERYQVRLFDLLAIGNEDWRGQPYQVRREKLHSLVRDESLSALCHAQEFRIDSLDQLRSVFNRCQAEGWEGLVLKQMDVLYRSGTRNPGCIKLKPIEPIDATIIGYFSSTKETVETFLLALYNEKTGQFEACGRTRAGLSPQNIEAILALIEPIKRTTSIDCVATEAPTVWVTPIFIFEFVSDYRYASDRYPCALFQTGQGWALHNPIFLSAEPRLDKEAHHTTSIEQFLRLRTEAGQSIAQQQIVNKEPNSPEKIQQLDFGWNISDSDTTD